MSSAGLRCARSPRVWLKTVHTTRSNRAVNVENRGRAVAHDGPRPAAVLSAHVPRNRRRGSESRVGRCAALSAPALARRGLIETAVSDHDMPQVRDRPAARSYYDPSGIGDETNWFVSNLTALCRWFKGAGFEVGPVRTWPDPPQRAHIRAQAGPPPRYLRFANAFERPPTARRLEPADSVPRRRS